MPLTTQPTKSSRDLCFGIPGISPLCVPNLGPKEHNKKPKAKTFSKRSGTRATSNR